VPPVEELLERIAALELRVTELVASVQALELENAHLHEANASLDATVQSLVGTLRSIHALSDNI
jgi:FtsZ-binding cell division protein ZapB